MIRFTGLVLGIDYAVESHYFLRARTSCQISWLGTAELRHVASAST